MNAQEHFSQNDPLFSFGKKPFIRSAFNDTYDSNLNFTPYTLFVEEILKCVLPAELLHSLIHAEEPALARKSLARLDQLLPCFHVDAPKASPGVFIFTLLCQANFTNGVGRYVSDCLSRWLIPGKFFPLCAVHSLNFQFLADRSHNFFMHQVIVEVKEGNELTLIKNNVPALMEEMRLNIMAVQHARSVMTISTLSEEQKSWIIQENIATIIDRPSKEFDSTLYDQMHQFFIKLSAEEKIGQIKESFASFIKHKPNIFDRDIYSEIQYFVLIFRETFTALRPLKHVGRIISYQYIFRKLLQQQMKARPKERHLVVKLVKTQLQQPIASKSVVGVLIGINVLSDLERFEKTHILKALNHCLPGLKAVKDSYIVDQRSQDKIRLLYLEIEKEDYSPFTLPEMKQLKKRIIRELNGQFENVIHHVFMPRNDEEILRNILLLANQLKYVKDIPQVVISFEKQGEEDLSFTIILLRLLRSPEEPSLEEILSKANTFLKFHDFEVKQVGRLRHKYVKEANIFKVILDKKRVLRKDYSLDIFKARHAVYSELSAILGEVRDFNGGILSKQHEVFHELRQSLLEEGQNDDFLLESFFYSLNPPLMRSIFSSSLLKSLYIMLVENGKLSLGEKPFQVVSKIEEEYLLVMIVSAHGGYHDKVLQSIASLKIPSTHVASAFVEDYETSCLGFIARLTDEKGQNLFLDTIEQALSDWSVEILTLI